MFVLAFYQTPYGHSEQEAKILKWLRKRIAEAIFDQINELGPCPFYQGAWKAPVNTYCKKMIASRFDQQYREFLERGMISSRNSIEKEVKTHHRN